MGMEFQFPFPRNPEFKTLCDQYICTDEILRLSLIEIKIQTGEYVNKSIQNTKIANESPKLSDAGRIAVIS